MLWLSRLCDQVDPSCEYKNVVTIDKFESYYTFCGGINMPKRIGCLGSDGVLRQLLIKVCSYVKQVQVSLGSALSVKAKGVHIGPVHGHL